MLESDRGGGVPVQEGVASLPEWERRDRHCWEPLLIHQGSGFKVRGAEFRVQGSRCRVQGSGFRVLDSGYVQGVSNTHVQVEKGVAGLPEGERRDRWKPLLI